MITIDSDPKLNPLNIGAFIINCMVENDFHKIGIDKLYGYVRNEFNASYDVYVYTLDWLYLTGIISLSDKGKIVYET